MAEPSQAITAMEIIDTTVKIGLGALISGLATYLVTKLNHDKDLEKQFIHRRRELLEQAATNVEGFWNAYRRYYLVSLEAIHREQSGQEIPEIQGEYESRKQLVMETSDVLSAAQSTLLLLDEQLAAETLKKLATETEAYMIATKSTITDKQIKELKTMHKSVLSIRNQFYLSLSNAYRKNL